MVEVFGAVVDVDLDPVHRARELVVAGPVLVTDAGAVVAADIGRLVTGEDHRDGCGEATVADLVAVDVERDGRALGETATVIGELRAHLVVAGRQRLVAGDGEALEPEQVVAVLRDPILGVHAPAGERAALGDDHALGTSRRAR